MFVVRGTKKFRDRVPGESRPGSIVEPGTNILGAWYATVLFWRPQVALFVNEPTRLPLFVPMAPGATVVQRMTRIAAAVFSALDLGQEFMCREVAEMGSHQLMKTASRSVLGTMNDFAYVAGAQRAEKDLTDLVELSLQLAQTPCGPLYGSHVS